jgi:arsenical pump membrane protein
MDQVLAYSTVALTVTLAISRPRIVPSTLRFTPGSAALAGITIMVLAGLLRFDDLVSSARIQWRPLLALSCIMVTTGVVQEVGAFERLAGRLEAHARRTSPSRAFALVFLVSAITPSLLNNDAAILLLTPLVVALTRRLYPGRAAVTEAFAFLVFLAPGVAPLVISNPMNMIVAEFAGIGFNDYARIMLPISIVGAVLTFLILRLRFMHLLTSAVATPTTVDVIPPHAAERPAFVLMLAVFAAYPAVAAFGGPIWVVSLGGAGGSLLLAWRYRVAPARKVLAHVSPDILVFLWGVFLLVVGLRHVGVVARLAELYQAPRPGSWHQLGVVGVVAALGSALVDNHPMSILNMMALDGRGGSRPLLAALVGGDIGPRLLPIGSLAGLLWTDLLRRSGVEITTGKFFRVGILVLVPTLLLSLGMLAFTTTP